MNAPMLALEPKSSFRFPRRVWWGLERGPGLFLAGILLYSAFMHLGNPYYFLSSIYTYQTVGITAGIVLALVLPHLQMAIGICLLARWWLLPIYSVSGCLFLLFIGAQLLALRRGLEISCGCFGAVGSDLVGGRSLLLAGSGLIASLFGLGFTFILQHRRESSNRGPSA